MLLKGGCVAGGFFPVSLPVVRGGGFGRWLPGVLELVHRKLVLLGGDAFLCRIFLLHRYDRCSPLYREVLKSTMIEDGKALWEKQVTEETLSAFQQEMVARHREKIKSTANEEARAAYEKEVFERVVAEYRGKLMREVGEEWKKKETERITEAVEKEYLSTPLGRLLAHERMEDC